MKKIPIIIDTDPGIDDAIAICIALFSKELDVKLITTVAGNVSLDKVTYNTMKLLKFLGKENIPVAEGCAQPLVREHINASNVHGETGMDGYDFPKPDMNKICKNHAVVEMFQTIMASKDKITLMPIAPLTNIAILLKMYPQVKEKIEKIVLMGGSISRGNFGVYSEFNIAVDPEAAKIVFESELPIVMAGADVGLKALVYPEMSEQIKLMNKTGDMFYSLFKKYRGGSFGTGLKMYDSCAIAYILKPELFTSEFVYVEIDTQNRISAGQTYVDLKGYLKKKPNITVLTDINQDKFKKWFLESVKGCA